MARAYEAYERIFSIAFSVIGCMCARRARTPSNLDPHGQCACTQMLVPRPGTGRPRSFASHIVLSRALAAAHFDRYMSVHTILQLELVNNRQPYGCFVLRQPYSGSLVFSLYLTCLEYVHTGIKCERPQWRPALLTFGSSPCAPNSITLNCHAPLRCK